jgi:hypothetical protein
VSAIHPPAVLNQSLISRYGQAHRERGFRAVREALFNECMLAIRRMSLDPSRDVPSVINVIRAFQPSNRELYADALYRLKKDYEAAILRAGKFVIIRKLELEIKAQKPFIPKSLNLWSKTSAIPGFP